MGAIQTIWKYFLFTSSLLALSCSATVFVGALLQGYEPSFELLAIPFLFIFSTFNLNRFTDMREDELTHPQRTETVKRLKHVLLVLIVVSFVALIGLALSGPPLSRVLFFFILAIAVFYSVKVIPASLLGGIRRLKDIPGVKGIFPTLGWALFGSYYPVAYMGGSFTQTTAIVFLFIALRFFLNTTMFDIRDYEGDKKNNIRSLPVLLGVERTRHLLFFLNAMSVVVLLVGMWTEHLPLFALPLAVMGIYGHAFISASRDKKVDMNVLCDVIIDGEMLVWVPLVIGGMLFFS